MLQETLIPGLEFANRFELTNKEMNTLVPFLSRPYTATDLAEKLNMSKVTLYGLIQRLKLKQLLKLKDRDSTGNNLYQFNIEILE